MGTIAIGWVVHESIKELVRLGIPENRAEAILRVQSASGDDPLVDNDAAVASLVAAGLPENQADVIVRLREAMYEERGLDITNV